jgi:hypothetical protein
MATFAPAHDREPAKPNAVLNKIAVAKWSSAKAKIKAAKTPGSKTISTDFIVARHDLQQFKPSALNRMISARQTCERLDFAAHQQRCKAPAIRGRRTCRMHGGGAGSGAPCGKSNSRYRHGGSTKAGLAMLRHINMLGRLLKRVPR